MGLRSRLWNAIIFYVGSRTKIFQKQFNLAAWPTTAVHCFLPSACLQQMAFQTSPVNVWSEFSATEGISFNSIKDALSVQILFFPAFIVNHLPRKNAYDCKIQHFKVALNIHNYCIPVFSKSKPFLRHFTILSVTFNYLACSFFWSCVCLGSDAKEQWSWQRFSNVIT